MIRRRAIQGTPRSSTRAAASGRTRSKAAAKIIRVEDSQRVPAQPMNHAPNRITIAIWTMWLSMRNAASIGG